MSEQVLSPATEHATAAIGAATGAGQERTRKKLLSPPSPKYNIYTEPEA